MRVIAHSHARATTLLFGYAAVPSRLRGLAVCRIFVGLAAVDFYISTFRYRDLMWGPRGYIDSSLFSIQDRILHLYSIYSWSTSPIYFQAVFFTGLLVAVFFTVCGGRWLALLEAIFLWSIYNRNGSILDGGDNLARILTIFFIFAATDAYYSPLAARRRRVWLVRSGEALPSIRVLLHNSAVLLITFQIATVYFVAGMWKVAGPLWEDGTAMYYVARTLDFRFVSIAPFTTIPIVTTAITYFAIAANLVFPLGLFTRKFRFVTVAAAMMMHAGIIISMGLVGFGVTMVGADLACLSDLEYEQVLAIASRARSALRQGVRRDSRAQAGRPEVLDLASSSTDAEILRG